MLVVIGGNSRNIGKTSVMAALIRAVPEARWTAMKITQYGHRVCSHSGASCGCETGDDHPYALVEEREPNRTDTGRFLAAGATRSFWLRTEQGRLGEAAGVIRRLIESSENAVFESNSVLQFFRPDLYVPVLDFSVDDVKDSLRRFLDRADAVVLIDRGAARPPWKGIPARWIDQKPRFVVSPPDYSNDELARLVRDRLQ